MRADVWTYREGPCLGSEIESMDLAGFGVEALDGSIGKVDEATYGEGTGELVVDTGPWIFGKKVLLPAGVVSNVDTEDEKVFVNRTKEQIKNAPEYEAHGLDDSYRERVGSYYGAGVGYRGWDDAP